MYFAAKEQEDKSYYLFNKMLFFCFGYMTGSDWRIYENNYYRMSGFSDLISYSSSSHEEIRYNFLVALANTLGIGFWPFHIALECLVILTLFKTIESFNVCVSQYFVLYFASVCFIFIDCPFRNMIAWGIFLYSIRFIKVKRLVPYLISCAIATSIHFTGIIMIPIYFIYHKRKTMNLLIVLLVMAGLYVFAFMGTGLIEMVNMLTATSEFAEERLSNYTDSDTFSYSPINSVTIFYLILFIIVFLCRKDIEKQQYGKEMLNLFYLHQILIPIANSFRIFDRFTLYLVFFSTITTIYLFRSVANKELRMSLISFVILFSFAKLCFVLTQDCRYIPYSNYLQYIGDQPSYGYRDSYNPHNSPYKDFNR